LWKIAAVVAVLQLERNSVLARFVACMLALSLCFIKFNSCFFVIF
jgi:hypothetical protein